MAKKINLVRQLLTRLVSDPPACNRDVTSSPSKNSPLSPESNEGFFANLPAAPPPLLGLGSNQEVNAFLRRKSR